MEKVPPASQVASGKSYSTLNSVDSQKILFFYFTDIDFRVKQGGEVVEDCIYVHIYTDSERIVLGRGTPSLMDHISPLDAGIVLYTYIML